MRRAAATGALGAALVVAGVLFALPSLLVPGVALALLAPAAATWVAAAARRATTRLRACPASVEEGRPVVVDAAARVPRWSPPAEIAVPSLGRSDAPGRRLLSLEAEASFERRGIRTLGPARVGFRDPLGLAVSAAKGPSAKVLVLPRVEPVRPGRRAGARGLDGGAGRAAGPELEFDSLRPHRPGAPAARIHWPTVARSGELVERRLTAESDSRPFLVLDAGAPASEEALDRAVRAAASLCRALASAGGCRVLLPNDRRATLVDPDLRAWPSVHARLALVEAAAPAALPRIADGAALFWVTAARRAAPRALLLAATAHRYLVLPDDPPASGAAFTVSGCAGVAVERAAGRAA